MQSVAQKNKKMPKQSFEKTWHIFIDTNLGEGHAIKSKRGRPWQGHLPTGDWNFNGSIKEMRIEVFNFCKRTEGYTHCFGRRLPNPGSKKKLVY